MTCCCGSQLGVSFVPQLVLAVMMNPDVLSAVAAADALVAETLQHIRGCLRSNHSCHCAARSSGFAAWKDVWRRQLAPELKKGEQASEDGIECHTLSNSSIGSDIRNRELLLRLLLLSGLLLLLLLSCLHLCKQGLLSLRHKREKVCVFISSPVAGGTE